MHRPTFIFLLPHQIATVHQNNQNKITSNNQKKQSAIIQSKTRSKQNITNTKTISSINRKINHKTTTTNYHNKQSKISQSKTRSNKPSKRTRKLSHQSILKSITENNRLTFAINNHSFYHIKMCCRRKFPRKPANNTHLIKTRHNHTGQPGQQRFGTR